MQWGIVTGSDFNAGSGTVVYNTEFINSTISIWTQPTYTGSTVPNNAATVAVKDNYDKTGFDWSFETISNKYTSFFWIAIGT